MVHMAKQSITAKLVRRMRRKRKIRGKIFGVQQRPRLTIYRSNRSIFVQAIDDERGVTMCSLASIEKGMPRKNITVERAAELAKTFTERLKKHEITELVFDRNGYSFHGVVASFVNALRSEEIKI